MAATCGLTPQQHQALLAIRGSDVREVTVGYLAQRLMLKPHSATGLVDRLETLGLLERSSSSIDRRQAVLRLTDRADDLLKTLSAAHRDELTPIRPILAALLTELA